MIAMVVKVQTADAQNCHSLLKIFHKMLPIS
jgi:hypothetical protein